MQGVQRQSTSLMPSLDEPDHLHGRRSRRRYDRDVPMKTSSMTRIKGALALVPMVLALSAFGSHSSYAYDPYDGTCPSPYYGYLHHDFPPYDYPQCGYWAGQFWWTHHRDHDDSDRKVHDHGFNHSHSGHEGNARGGYGHAGGGHGPR